MDESASLMMEQYPDIAFQPVRLAGGYGWC
jgi:hypothetical protein